MLILHLPTCYSINNDSFVTISETLVEKMSFSESAVDTSSNEIRVPEDNAQQNSNVIESKLVL